jgi:hypothetical protein
MAVEFIEESNKFIISEHQELEVFKDPNLNKERKSGIYGYIRPMKPEDLDLPLDTPDGLKSLYNEQGKPIVCVLIEKGEIQGILDIKNMNFNLEDNEIVGKTSL